MVRDGILCLSARSHSVKNAADTKLENTSLSAGVFQGPPDKTICSGIGNGATENDANKDCIFCNNIVIYSC